MCGRTGIGDIFLEPGWSGILLRALPIAGLLPAQPMGPSPKVGTTGSRLSTGVRMFLPPGEGAPVLPPPGWLGAVG